MPRKHLNLIQDMNLGSPRYPKPPIVVPNGKKKRSPHDAFAFKFHSISKKLLIFVLSQQLYTWLGQPMNRENCPKLIDLYLCGKINKKQFLRYLFQPQAIFQGFQFKTNNKGDKNEYLNQRLGKIVSFFNDDKNKIQLQQERKMIRQIFNDFKFVLPYALWFYVYANKCSIQKPQMQQLDQQFIRIYKIKFTRYIAKKKHLDMIPLCEPFLHQIKQRQLAKRDNISEQQRKQFSEIKERQKHLTVEYTNYNLKKFQIPCSVDSKKLLPEKKEELMKHLMKYHLKILSLTDQQSTNSVLRRYQQQTQAPVNVRRRRSRRNQVVPEQGEIQVQRSRSPERKQIIEIQSDNQPPSLSLFDEILNEKQNQSVYEKMQPERELDFQYSDQFNFSFSPYWREQDNLQNFLKPYKKYLQQW